jgi:hypothetical protein
LLILCSEARRPASDPLNPDRCQSLSATPRGRCDCHHRSQTKRAAGKLPRRPDSWLAQKRFGTQRRGLGPSDAWRPSPPRRCRNRLTPVWRTASQSESAAVRRACAAVRLGDDNRLDSRRPIAHRLPSPAPTAIAACFERQQLNACALSARAENPRRP